MTNSAIGAVKIRLEPLRLFVSGMVKLDWKDGVAGCGGSCFSCLTRTWIGSIAEVCGARQGQLLHAGVPSWGERSCSASLGIILPRTTTRTLPRLASGDASSTLVCGSDSIRRQITITGKLATLSRRNLNLAILDMPNVLAENCGIQICRKL